MKILARAGRTHHENHKVAGTYFLFPFYEPDTDIGMIDVIKIRLVL